MTFRNTSLQGYTAVGERLMPISGGFQNVYGVIRRSLGWCG